MLFDVHGDRFLSFRNRREKFVRRTRKAALVKNNDRPVLIGISVHRSVEVIALSANLDLKQRCNLFYTETAKP